MYGDFADVIVRTVVGNGDLVGAVATGVAMGRTHLLDREIEEANPIDDIDRLTILVNVRVSGAVIGAHRGPVERRAILDGRAGDSTGKLDQE